MHSVSVAFLEKLIESCNWQRPALVMTDTMHGDESHVRHGESSLSNGSRSESVTCPSCHVTVALSRKVEENRRLICPYCGAVYSHEDSRLRAINHVRDPLHQMRVPILVCLDFWFIWFRKKSL